MTLSEVSLPVKSVVLNNGTLCFVELEMKTANFVNTIADPENRDLPDTADAMSKKGFSGPTIPKTRRWR